MRLALALVLLSQFSLAQSTWHVNVAAAAPGDGSPSSPFTSIQYAHDQPTTLEGDEIVVAPGLYDEHITISKVVTLRSSGGPLVTLIKPSTNNPANSTVRIPGIPTFDRGPIVEGFTIFRRPHASAIGVRGQRGVLRRCIVDGAGGASAGAGVAVLSDYDLWLEHCLVTDAHRGIQENGVSAIVYVTNTISSGNVIDFGTPVSSGFFVRYCCFQTPLGGLPTCISASPALFDLAAHDFHLTAASPCIDSGDPASPLDPDGSRADIGPLPFDPAHAPFTTYCTAKLNSQGCTPSISASGVASLTSNQPFALTCVNELNQKLGLYFYGYAPKNVAYQGGYLCVQNPTIRTAAINSGGNIGPDDCSGVYSFDFNALIRSGANPALAPGREVFVQVWSRDPAASFNTNRSNALRATIQP